jgi:lipoprotein-releasing system permease protein
VRARLIAAGLALVAGAACSDEAREDPVKRAVMDASPHVIVMRGAGGTFAEYRDVIRIAETIDPAVAGVSPIAVAEVLATNRGAGESVFVKGLVPGSPSARAFDRYLVAGAPLADQGPLPADGFGVLVGHQLAAKLQLRVGDDLRLILPLEPTDDAPRWRTVRIAGVLHFGVPDLDQRMILTPLAAAQRLAGHGDQATGVELKLSDPRAARRVAAKLVERLGDAYIVMDYCELNPAILRC